MAELNTMPVNNRPAVSYQMDGTVKLVKRGNSWYILKG